MDSKNPPLDVEALSKLATEAENDEEDTFDFDDNLGNHDQESVNSHISHFFDEVPFSEEDDGSSYNPGSRLQSTHQSTEGTASGYASRLSSYPEEEFEENELSILQEDEIAYNEEIDVCYFNARVLNDTYARSLRKLLENLNDQLAANLQKQQQLEDELLHLSRGARPELLDRELKQIKKSLIVFGYPYFKDVNLFSHPQNPDTMAKIEKGDLDPYLTVPKVWTRENRVKLQWAVKNEAMRLCLRDDTSAIEQLHAKMKQPGLTEIEKQSISEQIEDKNRLVRLKKNLTDEQLLQYNSWEFDWLRVSAQVFDQSISPKSCELMWKNLVHPSINKKVWTSFEDQQIRLLAQADQPKTWHDIAQELGTSRTAMQCCMRYMSKIKPSFSRTVWTEKDDTRLIHLVKKLRCNNFIPWNKVAFFMEDKTNDQCAQRYKYSLRKSLRKGSFNETEDFMLLVGVKLFGESWTKIADFMPSRTPAQLHHRYNNFLRPEFKQWTQQEDRKLLESVQRQGTQNWALIKNDFPNTTRGQCRSRFFKIINIFQKDPDNFDLNTVKESQLQKRRQDQLKENLENDILNFQLRCPPNDDASSDYVQIRDEGKYFSMKSLYEYMVDLKPKLPVTSDTSAYASGPLRPMSAKSLGIHLPHLKAVIPTRKGDVKTVDKTKSGKILPTRMEKTNALDRMLYKFFRPSWYRPRRGRQRVHLNTDQLSRQCKIMGGLSHVLRFKDSIDVKLITPASLEDLGWISQQLLEFYAQNKAEVDSQGVPQVSQIVQPKPKRKTYSKKKVTVDPKDTEAKMLKQVITFVPPCKATLLGFRGMLLHLRKLEFTSQEESKVKRQHRFRNDTNDILKDSIRHHDVLVKLSQASREKDIVDESVEAKTADALLFERMKSLFFWPAVMSMVKREQSNDQSLFEEADEGLGLAAEHPLDVNDIIIDAQSRPPAKRIRIIKKETSKSTSCESDVDGDLESFSPTKKKVKLSS